MSAVVIALIGGSGSGKTTLAESLATAIAARHGAVSVTRLAEDDYYHDRASIPGFDPASYDFDRPEAKDFPLLVQHLTHLRAGQAVRRPVYSHATHSRVGEAEVAPRPVILLEGMHALGQLHGQGVIDAAVFLDTPDDVRLARRLMRDVKPQAEGGRDRTYPQGLAQYFRAVWRGQMLYVAPQRALADFVLNDSTPPVEAVSCDLSAVVLANTAAVMAFLTARGLV
jgi:uridine kinase